METITKEAEEKAYISNVLQEVINYFNDSPSVLKLEKNDLLDLVYEAFQRYQAIGSSN